MATFRNARPRAGRRFYKAHGLGNDYLVLEEGDDWVLEPPAVAEVCHRWEGVGSDGVVVLLDPDGSAFRLRMFNPDGSEFERSGNGLRVLASYLHRTDRVETGEPFDVEVGGDRVRLTVHGRTDRGHYDVSVAMGRAHTGPRAVDLDPVVLTPVEDEDVRAAHGLLTHPDLGEVAVHLVSVGNPHCAVFVEGPEPSCGDLDLFAWDVLDHLGPWVTDLPAFERGVNTQLARVVEPGVVEVLIWERGVGPTLASGTSACAVAVAAVRSGRVEAGRVEVRMEGGSLEVTVDEELDVTLRGPVQEVCEGELSHGFLATLGAVR